MTESDRRAEQKEIIKLNRQLGEALGILQGLLINYGDIMPDKQRENIEKYLEYTKS